MTVPTLTLLIMLAGIFAITYLLASIQPPWHWVGIPI